MAVSGGGDGRGGDVAVGGDAEADGFGAAGCGGAGLGDFVVGGGEADLEPFCLAGPAFALGTLVITPYFPYRDCMPVFRYDTRDVAQCLPDAPLRCELAGIPATSHILGKADGLLRLPGGEVVTPRQLVDAIEALPAEPWPARYRATVCDGRIRLTLPAGAIAGCGEAEAVRHFAAAGLDMDLEIVGDDQAASLRHTRSDLHETTFASQHALVGA